MTKYEILKAMHTIVLNLNNNEAYYDNWIHLVPDGATDNDLWIIATNEDLFSLAVTLFKNIMTEYLEDGIYIGRKVY